MGKSIVKQFSVIGMGTFISLILGFVSTPVITRMIDTVEYGKYSMFVMYANMALVVFTLGLDQSYLRYFNQAENMGENHKLFYRCTFYPVAFAIIVGAVLCAISYFVPGLLEFDIGILMLLSVYTVSLVILRQIQLTARLKFKTKIYSALAIADKALYIILIMFAFFGLRLASVDVLAFSITAAAVGAVLLGFFLLRKDLRFEKGQIKSVKTKELITYGVPFVFSLGLTVMFQSADKLALKYFTDYSQIGIYKSAETMVNVFAVLQTTFNALWMPMAIKRFEENPEDKDFHTKGNEIISLIMFVFGITVIVFKDVLVYWLGADYRIAATILPALIFNPIMYTISETTVTGIMLAKKSYMHIVIAAVSCVVNIVGNFVLIPMVGTRGAAISTGFAYIVFFMMRSFIAKRYFNTGADIPKCIGVSVLAFLYALYSMFTGFGYLNILAYLVTLSLILILYKGSLKLIIRYIINKLSGQKGDLYDTEKN